MYVSFSSPDGSTSRKSHNIFVFVVFHSMSVPYETGLFGADCLVFKILTSRLHLNAWLLSTDLRRRPSTAGRQCCCSSSSAATSISGRHPAPLCGCPIDVQRVVASDFQLRRSLFSISGSWRTACSSIPPRLKRSYLASEPSRRKRLHLAALTWLDLWCLTASTSNCSESL